MPAWDAEAIALLFRLVVGITFVRAGLLKLRAPD